MSAELVDPFTTPPRQPLLTPEEWRDIRDEIWDKPWNDQHRFPDLLVEAVKVLGEIATGHSADPAHSASVALREMVYRARVGAWRREIEAEPAWSIDPDVRITEARRQAACVDCGDAMDAHCVECGGCPRSGPGGCKCDQNLWPDREPPLIRRVETVVEDL